MGRITSLFARKMVAAAGAGAGSTLDQGDLLRSVGLDPDAAPDPKLMLPDTVYYDLLERIAAQMDATDLPLRCGATMRTDEYGALGLAWKSAPTLGGSFARVARYARLWTNVVEYELCETPEGALYRLHRAGPRRLGLRLSNETTLASTLAISREVATAPVRPLAVFFRHKPPKSIDAHSAYFGCPVQFEADQDALLFSPESLACPNRLGDEGITRFLLSHLEAEMRALVEDQSLESVTKDAIARALSEGVPKMPEIARRLGFSARSFHRRLSDHGLSFQTLTQVTQRELAEGLLRDDHHSLAEIAFLTGFSEQSAFSRAFKRWVGKTPASYRKDRQVA